MKIAIVGNAHGRLNGMHSFLDTVELIEGQQIHCAIQLGKFQVRRGEEPLKSFQDYSLDSAFCEMPRLTYFLGGNNGDSPLLNENIPNVVGVARNLVYLSRSGVGNIDDVRVCWISGNYSPERFDDNDLAIKPEYFRRSDLEKIVTAARNGSGIDILVMHDWPSIERLKNHITRPNNSGKRVLDFALEKKFGCVPLYELVEQIRPKYVFAGHRDLFLNVGLKFGENNTEFVSLKWVGTGYSTAILDTNRLDLKFYNDFARGLFDIIEDLSERNVIEEAFNYLGKDNLSSALAIFERVVNNNSFSERAISFAHYGFGVLLMKLMDNKIDPTTLDKAIIHLESSLKLGIRHNASVEMLRKAKEISRLVGEGHAA